MIYKITSIEDVSTYNTLVVETTTSGLTPNRNKIGEITMPLPILNNPAQIPANNVEVAHKAQGLYFQIVSKSSKLYPTLIFFCILYLK